MKNKNKYTAVQIKDLVERHFVNNAPAQISFAGIGERYASAGEHERKMIETYVRDICESYEHLPNSADKMRSIIENPMMFVQNNFGLLALAQKQLSTPELKDLCVSLVSKYDLSKPPVDKDKVVEMVRRFVNSDDFLTVYDHVHKLFVTMQDNVKL